MAMDVGGTEDIEEAVEGACIRIGGFRGKEEEEEEEEREEG